MAVFTSTNASVLMPREIADGMVRKVQSTSTIAKLADQTPMRFGKTDILTFGDLPKAEFVEEGGDKSSTNASFASVTAVPHKAHVTMRFSNEVLWADEDYQLDVLKELADAGRIALSRALDLGIYHGINPLTGQLIASFTNKITSTTLSTEYGGSKPKPVDPDAALRAAAGKLLGSDKGVEVTGAAFDPRFAWALADLKRADGTGITSDLRYPQLGLGTDITSFMGLAAAVGSTVSATPEATDTKVRAIVGDFKNGLRWGVQRELPVELIQYGDPDGNGDLKRKNQIALRLEMVYGWYAFIDRFAVVKEAAA